MVLYGSGASGNHHAEFFRSQRAVRAERDHAARTGRRRADPALVARARPSFAAADERRRSAQLRRQLPHRISRHEGSPQGAVRHRRHRRPARRHQELPRASRARTSRQAFSSETAGGASSFGPGEAAEVMRGFGIDLLHAGPPRAAGRRDRSARRSGAPWSTSCARSLGWPPSPFEVLLDIREDKAGRGRGRLRSICSRSIWNAFAGWSNLSTEWRITNEDGYWVYSP